MKAKGLRSPHPKKTRYIAETNIKSDRVDSGAVEVATICTIIGSGRIRCWGADATYNASEYNLDENVRSDF